MTRTTITHTLATVAIFAVTLSAADAADDNTFLAASRSGDVAQVQSLLADGANVNATDASGNTALHFAAAFGFSEIAQTLVAAGADVDARGRIDNTPLHLAAQEGHSDVAALLIDNGADVYAANEFGGTAVAFASGWGHFDIADQVERASQPTVPVSPLVWFVIATAIGAAFVGFAVVSTSRSSSTVRVSHLRAVVARTSAATLSRINATFHTPFRSNSMTRNTQDLREFGLIHGLTAALVVVVFLVGAMSESQRGASSIPTPVSLSETY